MKALFVTIPDSEFAFFMEFIKRLKNSKVEELDYFLSDEHKKLLDERIQDLELNPTNEVQWGSVKKKLQSNIKKSK